MNITKQQAIVLKYRETRSTYLRLERLVTDRLTQAIHTEGIRVMSIEHRVKTVDSL